MTPEMCAEQAAGPLAAATEQVLETMFFTTIEGTVEKLPEDAGEMISALLPFHGEISGVFRLDLSLTSARRMSAGFLAEDEESLVPARVGEAICELANVICGSALSHMRSEHLFELLVPHLAPAADFSSSYPAAHVFQLEDGFIRVSVQVQ